MARVIGIKLIWCFLTSKEYTLSDLIKDKKVLINISKYLWQKLMNVNFENLKQFKVPIIFIEGRYDYHVSSEIVKEYYNSITSHKSFYWFEKSCHFLQWCEADKFNDIIIGLLND